MHGAHGHSNQDHQILMGLKSLNRLWSNLLIILAGLIDKCIANGPFQSFKAEVNIRSDGRKLLVKNMVTHRTVQINDG